MDGRRDLMDVLIEMLMKPLQYRRVEEVRTRDGRAFVIDVSYQLNRMYEPWKLDLSTGIYIGSKGRGLLVVEEKESGERVSMRFNVHEEFEPVPGTLMGIIRIRASLSLDYFCKDLQRKFGEDVARELRAYLKRLLPL